MEYRTLILLPNTLFDISIIKKVILDNKINKIILWEHSHYFTKYTFNKKKLLLHRSSMKFYENEIIESDLIKLIIVKYIGFNKKLSSYIHKKYENFWIFDPVEREVIEDFYKIIKRGKIELLESPNFLLNKEYYSSYRNKTKSLFFNSFYMWGKSINNIMNDVKSQDKNNREVPKKNEKINTKPLEPILNISNTLNEKKLLQYSIILNDSKKYIQNNFKNNYGNLDNFYYPINRNQSLLLLKYFIKNNLNNFGKYQDVVWKEGKSNLYHSLLSSSINIGLLNPIDIIREIEKYFKISLKELNSDNIGINGEKTHNFIQQYHKKNNKNINYNNIDINSLEGYIRQLYWREYQRYCYIYAYDLFYQEPHFNNLNKKIYKEWYDGTVKSNNILIEPINKLINKAFNTAYLHHIERLMFIGNFMILSEIDPWDGFTWFMEFSIDSYEWVMYQNVLDMIFFISGGKTTRRPYFTSGNYPRKMSDFDYSSDNIKQSFDEWTRLYYNFLKKNRKKIEKFKYFFPLHKL